MNSHFAFNSRPMGWEFLIVRATANLTSIQLPKEGNEGNIFSIRKTRETIFPHPDFSYCSFASDVALILAPANLYDERVRGDANAICVTPEYFDYSDPMQQLKIAGFNSKTSMLLQTATYNLTHEEECHTFVRDASTEFCAGLTSELGACDVS